MKTKIIRLFIIHFYLLAFSSVLSADETSNTFHLSADLQVNKISEDAFLVTHSFPWPANSLLIRYPGKYIVWVDTPYTDKATKLVWNWIKTRDWQEKLIEVNTGFHNDNLGGNGFLLKNFVDVYGTELIVKMLNEQSEKTRAQILKWLQNQNSKNSMMFITQRSIIHQIK